MTIEISIEPNPKHHRIIEFDFAYECQGFYDIKDIVSSDIGCTFDGDRKMWYIPVSDFDQESLDGVWELDRKFDCFAFMPDLKEWVDYDVVVSNPGSTVYVSMKYDCYDFHPIKETIKNIGGRWDGEDNVWELENTSEQQVEDVLSQWNHVYIEGSDNDETDEEVELDLNDFDGELYDFQKQGAEFIKSNSHKGLIAHSVGLGKTVESFALLDDADSFPALIVVPASSKEKWGREVEDFLPLKSYYILNGESGAIPMDRDIYICNYAILHHREKLFDLDLKGMVVDEAHNCKNESAKRTKCIHRLVNVNDLETRLLLSATPFLNSPDELTSLLKWLDVLHLFGGEDEFLSRYCKGKYAVTISCSNQKYHRAKNLLDDLNATHSGEGTKYYLPLHRKDEFWDKLYNRGLSKHDIITYPEFGDFEPKENSEDQQLLEQVNQKLDQRVMDRTLKEDVVDQLPDKIVNKYPVPINMEEYKQKEQSAIMEAQEKHSRKLRKLKSKLDKLERRLVEEAGTSDFEEVLTLAESEDYQEYKDTQREIQNKENRGPTITLPLISELRQFVGIRKISSVAQWSNDIYEPHVIFGWHQKILEKLQERLDNKNTALYYGGTPKKKAEKMITDFQDGEIDVFLGQIEACGEAIQLIRGSHTNVGFVEFPWGPQQLYQAEGRLYARIGDMSGITSNYFYCPGTVDEDMLDVLETKSAVFSKTIDNKEGVDFSASDMKSEIVDRIMERH